MADFHSLPITSQFSENKDPDSTLLDQKILLVCVINYKRINITFDFLYNMFNSYGEVKKILFFEKTLTWKAFVEMGTTSQANKAKNSLNNMSLFSDGSKLNIYLSNLKELVLPKNMMNGRDYTKPIEPMVNSFQEISENEKVKNAFYSFSLQDIQQMDETNQKTNFHFRKTNTFEFKPSSMSQIDFKNLNKLAAIQENDEHQSKLFNREHSLDRMISESSSQSKTLILSEPPGLSRSISFQKQKEMKSAELSKKSSISTSTTLPSPFLNTATSPPIPLKISNSLSCNNLVSNNENTTPINESNKYASNFNVFAGEASKVLFVKGLEDPHIKVNFIYNLFSNFGNITKIIFLRNKNGALIEFQSIEYATIAKDFLNNLNFFSNYLRISYSNYQEIVLKNANFGALKEDIMICDEGMMRFKKNKNILINPPSNVIHLSNLTKEACHEEKIQKFLEGYGNIEKIKFLIQENQKNMCLVKLSKLEEGLLIVSSKHNCQLEGRDVKISFTKTKI